LVRHTEGIEFGLLPTPLAVQRDHPERVEELIATGAQSIHSRKNGEERPNSILDAVQFYGLIPTPTANPSNRKLNEDGKSVAANGKRYGTSLQQFATQLLPTPREAASRGNCSNDRGKGNLEDAIAKFLPTPMASDCGEKVTGLENQDSLVKRTRQMTGKTSQLNPRFVAEMMGFPPNWMELPFQSGDKKA